MYFQKWWGWDETYQQILTTAAYENWQQLFPIYEKMQNKNVCQAYVFFKENRDFFKEIYFKVLEIQQ